MPEILNNQTQSKCTIESYKENICFRKDAKKLMFCENKNSVAHLHQFKICLYNKLQKNFHLTNKKALFINLNDYCAFNSIDIEEIVPTTYYVNKRNLGSQLTKIQNFSVSQSNQITWIVKPGEDTNRGVGINLFKNFE